MDKWYWKYRLIFLKGFFYNFFINLCYNKYSIKL
uniref:Uncharacterized protein n=1 Tax=Podoviridae sp. ctiuS14 TaxID=2827620 RepID=A0A8S5LMD7_9CAUD|nr:MAG TPA: hypothetical protein [Podoviridae sp. ctiuS14]